jgi:hypothetical protein
MLLPNLSLDLSGKGVTDAGLPNLRKMTKLERLDLTQANHQRLLSVVGYRLGSNWTVGAFVAATMGLR